MGTMKDPDDADILARYVRDGRLQQYPARTNARIVVLVWLVDHFTPGRFYTEAEVNDLLAGHALDHASLRRYLIDAGLLARANGVYWRGDT